MKSSKFRYLRVAFVLLVFFSVSCSKPIVLTRPPKNPVGSKVTASMMIWKKFKKQWNNNYRYVNISKAYTKGEVTIRTYVTVKSGKVVSAYQQMISLEEGAEMTKPKQNITGEKLRQIKTMDEIYTFAATSVAKKLLKDNQVTFKVFSNGLLLAAGYSPKSCLYQCYKGYMLEEVSPLK